jgi:hypothetical protein
VPFFLRRQNDLAASEVERFFGDTSFHRFLENPVAQRIKDEASLLLGLDEIRVFQHGEVSAGIFNVAMICVTLCGPSASKRTICNRSGAASAANSSAQRRGCRGSFFIGARRPLDASNSQIILAFANNKK